MKKIAKIITFVLIAGTIAAGIYYYFKSREDDDSFEDSDSDVSDDLDEFLKNEEKDADNAAKREYVPLKFENSSEAAAE